MKPLPLIDWPKWSSWCCLLVYPSLKFPSKKLVPRHLCTTSLLFTSLLFTSLTKLYVLIKELLEPARDAAWLVPMAVEYIFRSKGHHDTPALKSDYVKRYDSIFKASMTPDVGTFSPSDLLYHYAFHWITPARICWGCLGDYNCCCFEAF